MKSEGFGKVLSVNRMKNIKKDESEYGVKIFLKRIERDSLRGIIHRANSVKSEEKLEN